MNREYNYKVSSKNSRRLLKNLQNTTGDYFFLPHPVEYVYKILKLCTHPLTNGLINWIIVIKCDVSKAPKALRSTVLNEIDVVNMSKLREILRQDWLISCLLQTTNKDLTNTNLIFTMQRLLYSKTQSPNIELNSSLLKHGSQMAKKRYR